MSVEEAIPSDWIAHKGPSALLRGATQSSRTLRRTASPRLLKSQSVRQGLNLPNSPACGSYKRSFSYQSSVVATCSDSPSRSFATQSLGWWTTHRLQGTCIETVNKYKPEEMSKLDLLPKQILKSTRRVALSVRPWHGIVRYSGTRAPRPSDSTTERFSPEPRCVFRGQVGVSHLLYT